MNKIILSIASLFFFNSSYAKECTIVYAVNYIPLSTKFFVPIKEEDIERRSHCAFKTTSCEIDAIFGLNTMTENVPSGGLRIKIQETNSQRTVFITSKKELIRDSKVVQADSEMIQKAIQSIESKAKSCKKN